MTRYTYHLSPRLLARLDVGAVIETVYLANYGTQAEGVQSETVTKVSDMGIWTDKGNRYSRRTGERWGDGGSNFPRCIFQVIEHAPQTHPVLVQMERVGRNHDVEFRVDWNDRTSLMDLANAISANVGTMLMSSSFVVGVDENGSVSIDGGRFGKGTWTREYEPA